MARPKKDSFDYFPHDTDASGDEKIEAMRTLYGNDGYAFYFILLERIYRKNGVLELQNPAILKAIQQNITSDGELFSRMLQTSFEIGLFDRAAYDEHGILTSRAIECRVYAVNSERERKRQWNESKKIMDVHNTAERRPLTHKDKVKDKEKVKQKTDVPPIVPQGMEDAADGTRFETFWQAYPKKSGKGAAERAFAGCKADEALLERMLKAIDAQRRTDQWQRENGQFIPNPATWLKQRRWEDEATTVFGSNHYAFLDDFPVPKI